MKLVTTKTNASANRTIATVPEITFVKYKPAINTATNILIALSVLPIFLFILKHFIFLIISSKVNECWMIFGYFCYTEEVGFYIHSNGFLSCDLLNLNHVH